MQDAAEPVLPGTARLRIGSARAVHAHGALAGIELSHGGASSPNGGSRAARMAPSQVASELQWGGLAHEMAAADIRRVQRDWVSAARRARDAGFGYLALLPGGHASPDRRGGTAGMECAVVLRRRGFESVHLVEAEPKVGGRLAWTRRLPTLGDRGRIVDYRAVPASADLSGDLRRAPARTRNRRPRPVAARTVPARACGTGLASASASASIDPARA